MHATKHSVRLPLQNFSHFTLKAPELLACIHAVRLVFGRMCYADYAVRHRVHCSTEIHLEVFVTAYRKSVFHTLQERIWSSMICCWLYTFPLALEYGPGR